MIDQWRILTLEPRAASHFYFLEEEPNQKHRKSNLRHELVNKPQHYDGKIIVGIVFWYLWCKYS